MNKKDCIHEVLYEPERIKVASLIFQSREAIKKAITSGQRERAEFYSSLFLQNLFIKAKSWEHEKEYRIVYPLDNSVEGMNVPVSDLGLRTSRIIVGINCSENNIIKLNDISNELGLGSVYKSRIHSEKYTLDYIMWRLYGVDGTDKDYAIFKIPFINVVDKVFAIRPFFTGWGRLDSNVSKEDARVLDVTWHAQENFAGKQNSLVVIDGSGSMYGGNPMPATVAQSLGLYFAEKNTGVFANHFITFSSKPQLVEVKGRDLLSKLQHISSYDEVADTNIQAVFELILRTAVKNNVPQSEMPERIFIISDMEFNYCTNNAEMTNFEYAKKSFEEAGYKLPKVIFWNVASRVQQIPVTKNEQGVTLVSGCNARLFQQVLSDNIDPLAFMMEIVGSARYEKIVA